MEEILNAYKEKLNKEIEKIKAEIEFTTNVSGMIEEIRNNLSTVGKNLLASLYDELVKYVEEHNPDFVNNKKEEWEAILDKAGALKEYGLYVAPIDLLVEDNKTLPVAVGVGAFLASCVLSKLFFKKVKLIPSVLIGAIGGVGYELAFGENQEKKREILLEYVDDASDWINTALENMYKTFKDATA